MDGNSGSHELVWDTQKVSSFWSFVSNNPALEHDYFGGQAGRAVLEAVKHYLPLKGRLVDYGCGPGMFMEHLFAEGIACEGLDSSRESLEVVEKKFRRNPLFKGAILADQLPTPIETASVDTVFFLETVEHLLPDQLAPTIREIYRILGPGGSVVLTTPNNEDLAKSAVFCPECGSVFHRWQHIRAFTKSSLVELMDTFGFERVACRASLFCEDPLVIRTLMILAARLRHRPLPNLIYIGRKGEA